MTEESRDPRVDIIGLSGPAGAGKTTVAQLLEREILLNWRKDDGAVRITQRLSFATAVRREVDLALCHGGYPSAFSERFKQENIPATHITYQPAGEGKAPDFPALKSVWWRGGTGREFLQWWGTDVRRAEKPSYWIEQYEQAILQLRKEYQRAATHIILITDDMRFPDEFEYVWKSGGFTIHLRAPRNAPGSPLSESEAAHASEHGLSEASICRHDMVLAPAYGALEQEVRHLSPYLQWQILGLQSPGAGELGLGPIQEPPL